MTAACAPPSPPRPQVILDYIEGRARKYDVVPCIRFGTEVVRVCPHEASGRLEVLTRSYGGTAISDADASSELFDHVLVGSGMFDTPHVPELPGLSSFPGVVLHARDFRDAARFAGQTVLLVGNSDSGVDIASQLYKYGAREVAVCGRSEPPDYNWPGEVVRLTPQLRELAGRTAAFVDGSVLSGIDAVVLCTGYRLHYPFMADGLRLESTQRMWTDHLHAGLFLMVDPRVAYLGTQHGWVTFPLFDAQAWYARDVVLGRIELPPREAMKREFAAWRSREDELETDDEMIDFEADYVESLMAATDYPTFDVRGVAALFKALEARQLEPEGIVTYRDESHRSVVTGAMAPPPATCWLATWDDSLAAFLGAPGNVHPPLHRPLHSYRMVALPEGHPNYDPSFALCLQQTVPEGVKVAPTPYGLGLFATRHFRRGECMYKTNALAWDPAGGPSDVEAARFLHVTNAGNFESSAATHTSAKGETGGRWVYGFDAFMNHSCRPNTVSPPNASWFEEDEDEVRRTLRTSAPAPENTANMCDV